MFLSNLPVFYINLKRSLERRNYIEKVFKNNALNRIEAIDGLQFSTGEVDSYNRYKWNPVILKKLIQKKILNNPHNRYYNLMPTELGCNLSHLKAIKTFLLTKEEYAIIIEDDVEPVGDLFSIQIPDDADFFYLVGPEHPGNRIQLYSDNQVKWARTLMGYILSRKAGESILKALKTHYYQTDWQIPFRLFQSFSGILKSKLPPEWEELERFKAYGPDKSLIIHSEYAKISTFTASGDKCWIPEGDRI
jgi:GR25 family glycosyltransferase involved in LPS biosynthesis